MSAKAIIVEEAQGDKHPIAIPGMAGKSFDDAFNKENDVGSATATALAQGWAGC